MPRLWSSLAVLVFAITLTGCDAPPLDAVDQPPIEARQSARTASDLRQRQAAFLNRLREADPQKHTIDRAMMNGKNELGLILDRSVELEKIPALMKTVLGQMAREFPGQDLIVLAYTPSEPPRKVGTARLDAHTRDMTYTAEH
jgi:hypothetical protein